MPFDTIVVLVFVVAAFLIFMTTLAYAQHQTAKIPTQHKQ